MHRVKVSEVERLSQTISELEEAILNGGATINALHDYERKVYELTVRSSLKLHDDLHLFHFSRFNYFILCFHSLMNTAVKNI